MRAKFGMCYGIAMNQNKPEFFMLRLKLLKFRHARPHAMTLMLPKPIVVDGVPVRVLVLRDVGDVSMPIPDEMAYEVAAAYEGCLEVVREEPKPRKTKAVEAAPLNK